ncbi:MAG: ABC transporter substrate-binding protein [Synergistaceae bacterium]|nr:ABC transporter substrate-binding protein [Synergistaceae bacterium]
MTVRRLIFFAALVLFVSLILWRGRSAEIVQIGVLFDSGETSEAVISKQALQSVILAMEYFNSRSSSFEMRPVPIYQSDPVSAVDHAPSDISALITGPGVTFSANIAKISKERGIPVISLAAGSLIPGKESLVFRPRPGTGGFVLGREAARRGVKTYSVIVSGFDSGYVQEFIRDFEAGLGGVPPRRTIVFGEGLEKQIAHFDRIISGMDAMLLALPDWPAVIAFRELRLKSPGIPIFASNRVISHRSLMLAGNLGKDFLSAAVPPGKKFLGSDGFYKFVTETYGDHIPVCILAMGYDGAAMLSAALEAAKSADRASLAGALSGLEKIESSAGPVLVNDRGDLAVKSCVMSLEAGGWTPVKELCGQGTGRENQ